MKVFIEITQAQVKALIFDEALTAILIEYSNYSNVFSAKIIVKLSKHIGTNDHTIKLKKGKQLLFSPIYNLKLVKLETLKIYIKNKLANSFICLFKSPAGILLLFDWKPDKSLRFYVDYWGLNNIIIKN